MATPSSGQPGFPGDAVEVEGAAVGEVVVVGSSVVVSLGVPEVVVGLDVTVVPSVVVGSPVVESN